MMGLRNSQTASDLFSTMSDLARQLPNELDALWRFAIRLTGSENDAEELVQRTCVVALEKSDQYINRNRLRSWLFRIEHRVWLNEMRYRSKRSDFGQTPAHFGNLDEGLESATPESTLRLQQIYKAVESLPDVQRSVVLLVCVEGYTYVETASVLNVPVGTVMSRLSRARAVLVENELFTLESTSMILKTKKATESASAGNSKAMPKLHEGVSG